MDAGTDLAQICSKTDNGSGVAIGDCFAIYTAAVRPVYDGDQQELHNIVSLLRDALEIICTKDDLGGREIRPFGYAGASTQFEFLCNARRAGKHCIVGTGSPTDCLLAMLRRPWCLLEICCLHGTRAIRLLAQFAAAAEQLPGQRLAFEGATTLLSYELRVRTQAITTPPVNHMVPGALGFAKFDTLVKLSVALFAQSEKSYRKDVLRMMFVYAIHSGKSIRDILQTQFLNAEPNIFATSGYESAPSSSTNSASQWPKSKEFARKESLNHIRDEFAIIVQQMCEIIR